MKDHRKIAVVIDADNTQLAKIGAVLREISKYGRIVVKRAYGNWRKEALKNWESELNQLAIKAQQQFDYVPGKNTTDMALVIDTIELLYTRIYDMFVIVSSDSDYTPLAIKLRESGVYVMGVGEKKTPAPFKNACDDFLLLENVEAPAETVKKNPPVVKINVVTRSGAPVAPVAHPAAANGMEEIHQLLKDAYMTYKDDSGFANMAAVGSYIKRAKPDFDCRTYGHKKLPELLEAFPKLYKVRRTEKKGTTIVAYKCLK